MTGFLRYEHSTTMRLPGAAQKIAAARRQSAGQLLPPGRGGPPSMAGLRGLGGDMTASVESATLAVEDVAEPLTDAAPPPSRALRYVAIGGGVLLVLGVFYMLARRGRR